MAVAALALKRRLGGGLARAHPLPGDPVPAAASEIAQVLLRGQAAVDDPHAAAKPPAGEIVLDPLDHRLVGRVARPHPHPDRDPGARHRQPDHHLRSVGALVFGVAEAAQRLGVGIVLLILVLDLEVGRGRVEEQQVDLEVEQVGDREEHRLLHLALRVG